MSDNDNDTVRALKALKDAGVFDLPGRERYIAVVNQVFYRDRAGRTELFLTVHPTTDVDGMSVERQAMMLAELLSQLPNTLRSCR